MSNQPQEVKASLGCGTLILIAIIVILFSGHKDHDQLDDRIGQLTTEVQSLKVEISALRSELTP